ncbi:MAG: 16S rRNA (cytosine(967)-C(5))-methyltransferase RsmB [Clostridia bacterium]|nr:16S rRNA (cytosine(967)-C(5))-methyltransferase RsmB [Clostridia bacterium]
MTVREIALKLLLDYEENGKYVNLSLSSHLTDSLSREERGLLTHLLYTTVEHKLTYDYIIGALTGRSLDKLTSHTKNILRLGMCQLLDSSGMPDHAAVNATVSLAKNKGEAGLVNAVLRALVRTRDNLPFPKKEKNAARYYSVYYSIPLPTVRLFLDGLGEQSAVALFESFNKTPKTTLTVNTVKISVEDFIQKLAETGVVATRVEFSPISVAISGSVNPREIYGYSEGLFLVQDAASAVAASLQSQREGALIVDVCSAPGGKAMTAAILSGNKARVYAFDLHESKLSLIRDSAARLGLSSVSVGVRDARVPDGTLLGRADSVICDVPCSGLGVIAKKPDLRYKPLEDTEGLPALQLEILKSSSQYLRVGGRIVYSTCTLAERENEEVVREFLRDNHDFALVPFELGTLSAECGMITLYPHIHDTDGFFIALLERKR